MMIDNRIGVKAVVPGHYLQEYDVFVEFMNTYFDYIYRDRNGMPKEVQDALEGGFDHPAVRERGASASLRDHNQNMSLARRFRPLTDGDDRPLLDENGRPLLVQEDIDEYVEAWYADYGFFKPARGTSDEVVSNVDVVRVIKLLKDLFRIRGSKQAARLFFRMFFGVTPEIEYPRKKISTIDDNFVLDGDNVPRDDYYYQEYSYVIRLPVDKSHGQGYYVELFEKYFHPAGFMLFVENYDPLAE